MDSVAFARLNRRKLTELDGQKICAKLVRISGVLAGGWGEKQWQFDFLVVGSQLLTALAY